MNHINKTLVILTMTLAVALLTACEKNEFHPYEDVTLTIIAVDSAAAMITVHIDGAAKDTIIPPYETLDFEDFLQKFSVEGSGMYGLGIRPDLGPDAGKLFLGAY